MIEFHNEIEFVLQNQQELRRWIKKVITSENKEMGEINYIFCSDEYLLERNIKYLDHDTLTDIITFNYCKGQIITSDIMISIDRDKENSTILYNSFSEELHRVMIHGILHLIGYDDKTEKEKKLMREKENFYLKKLCN